MRGVTRSGSGRASTPGRRVDHAFTPRISLQSYGQLFLTGGHYSGFGTFSLARAGQGKVVHRDELVPSFAPAVNPDFASAALNANIVLRWEYALGSTLFLVYTRAQSPTMDLRAGERGTLDASGLGKAPAMDALLLKLTHFFG